MFCKAVDRLDGRAALDIHPSGDIPVQHADHFLHDDTGTPLQEEEICVVHHFSCMDNNRYCQRGDTAVENDAFHAVRSAEFCRRTDYHDHLLQYVADSARRNSSCAGCNCDSNDLPQKREVEEHQIYQEHCSHYRHNSNYCRSNCRSAQNRHYRHFFRQPQLRIQRLRHAVLFHHDVSECGYLET